MAPQATILSPHLDDAVLSCWHLLGGAGEVGVVNVFTATPPDPRSERYYWDRETGSDDSEVRMHERIAEDREALALAGVEPVNLDFLDYQYRGDPEAPPGVAERVRAELRPGTTVYAPAAFSDHHEYGRHPDHEAVRAVALELLAEDFDVSLYLDLPMSLQRGRPAWLPGGSADEADEVAARWDSLFAGAGLDPAGLSPQVHELALAAFEQKLEAVRAYRTQLPELERLAGLEALQHEVVWQLTSGTKSNSGGTRSREAVER